MYGSGGNNNGNCFESGRYDVSALQSKSRICLQGRTRHGGCCSGSGKEAGNGSGLIYGMGHAVYTLSDPRSVTLKAKAGEMAKIKGVEEEFMLYDLIEKLSPEILCEKFGEKRAFCSNIDLYSGFVYQMLNIPPELYTPLFAIARIVGWCSHRIEEVLTNGKIIRPAYKSVCEKTNYTFMNER